MQTIQNVGSAISSKVGKAAATYKSDNDAVIVAAVRTPITRAKKGGLKDMCPEDMLSTVFKGVIERSGIDPALIEDVAVGNVLPPGGGATIARMAALYAGIPNTAAVNTLNRQCSSGLASVAQIAHEIQLGQIEVGIGAGVESMTQNYGAGVMPEKMSDEVLSNEEAADCLMPMGITSENVAAEYGISRQQQDEFAANSFAKALDAQRAGRFKDEIVPVNAHWTDPKTEEEKEMVVSEDDGIRAGVTAESLGKLKPAFSKTGSTHAGNASQVSDGAAAVLLVRRSTANKLGLKILGKYVRSAVVGVPPKLMGIGPAYAIPKLLEQAGIAKDEIDIYEINEAFASQAVMSVQHIGLDMAKVNPNGGAIAFGHPLGATGSRQIATLMPEAKRRNAKLMVSSMCVGSGMGMAALFVNEQ